jgi:hypothetical protein
MSDNPTAEIPKTPEWVIDVTRLMQRGFDRINANLDLVSTDLSILKDRVALLETRNAILEERVVRASGRVSDGSSVDMEHEAKISEAIARQTALERQVAETLDHIVAVKAETSAQTTMIRETVSAVSAFARTPWVKVAGGVALGVIAQWLAQHGINMPGLK